MAKEKAAAAEVAEEGAEQPVEGGKGGKKGLIIAIVGVLVLGGGGFGAWKAFSGKKDDGKAAKEAEHKEVLPPRYVNLDPPFVVNFEAEAAVRFLQVTIGVMTRDLHTEELLKQNDPRVRNDMLMILSGQNYAAVSTTVGKEELRKKCLDAIRIIAKEMGGDGTKIEALYFTSFVMQ
jgi:flagellar protein FliL